MGKYDNYRQLKENESKEKGKDYKSL